MAGRVVGCNILFAYLFVPVSTIKEYVLVFLAIPVHYAFPEMTLVLEIFAIFGSLFTVNDLDSGYGHILLLSICSRKQPTAPKLLSVTITTRVFRINP